MEEVSTEPTSGSISVKNELAPASREGENQEDPTSGVERPQEEKKSKGTKRKASVDLQQYTCEVCQVKLNSASQAYQHFQGKGHQGKVKMLEMAAEVTEPAVKSPLNPCHNASESTPVLTPSTIDHFCSVCEKIFNSKNQAEQHFNGKAHRHKLSEQAISSIYPNIPGVKRPPQTANKPITKQPDLVKTIQPHLVKTIQPDLVKIGGNIKSTLFSCEHCHITLNSHRQYDQHVNGLRHKIIVGKVKPPPPPQGEEQPGWHEIRYQKLASSITTVGLLANSGSGTSKVSPGGTRLGQYYCKDCDVSVNSPIQLQQHMTSSKHSAKINGVDTVKRKPGRGRGGYKMLGRGAGRGRAVPLLSSNFVRGSETASYQQSTPIETQPAVPQLPKTHASHNGASTKAPYQNDHIDFHNSYSHDNWQPSYPMNMLTYP